MIKNILVIGASSGIGREMTENLLKDEKHRVIGGSRDLERLASFKDLTNFSARTCDVTQESAVQELFAALKSEGTALDCVVNCAGSVILKPAHLTSLSEFNSTITLNLTSCFLLLKYAIPVLNPAGASFLFFSTAAVNARVANHDAIAAAKSGVEGLTRAAAATYAAKNIRVNAIAPGLVKTPLTERIHGNAASAAASSAMHALGRLGEPADIASLACWMLSPAAQWMTGQVIGFDGGLSLKTR